MILNTKKAQNPSKFQKPMERMFSIKRTLKVEINLKKEHQY